MPKSRLRRAACALVIAALPTAAAALPAAASAKATITASGSTSVFPLAGLLAHGYLSQHPHSIVFKILQGGSDVGINDVAHGRVTVGDSSRDPRSTDAGGLVFNRIARDAVCVVTNPGNPVGNLSQAQVQAIFSGQVRSWGQVPGARVGGSIDLITRTAASGTADAFQNIFMGQTLRIAGSASQKASNGLVQQSVRSDSHAIGFVSFDFVSGLHAIPYEGVGCTLRNAKGGQYTGTRNFWMVTRGPAKGAAKSWINWIRSNGAASRIIASHWVPLH